MKEGEQQEWQAAGRDADTTGVLISPAPQQRKCAHLRFTVPLFFCRSQRREKERGRDEKRKQNKTSKTKKQKSHVWARWQAGSRRKCWMGRAVRCVWEWEGWRLPTQRPAAQQHSNPAETGQGETLHSPDAQGQGWAERRGGVDVFILLLKWGWCLETDTKGGDRAEAFLLERESVSRGKRLERE